MKKQKQDSVINITLEGFLSLVQTGLEHVNLFAAGAEKVNVKAVTLVNGGDTILVEFYARHSKSFDIKVEIGFIMSFLSGLLKDDLYKDNSIKMFGVKAFSPDDVEILYAVNTKAGAAASADGNSIGWLKTTLFQENTPDYRLARAKTMISEMETGLRLVIADTYEKRSGSGWWDLVIDNKVSNTVKNIYSNQFGTTINDGKILINYTFTLDLKKIISADWGAFRHFFKGKVDFENIMVELNEIRREEAHNRDVTEAHLTSLEHIYNFLLGEIAQIYPNVTVNYLVENWRSKIKEAVINYDGCAYSMEEFNQQDLSGRQQLLILDCNKQIGYLERVLTKLNALTPPPAKKKKHDELVSLLSGLLGLQQEKLRKVLDLDLNEIQELISSIQQQEQKMEEFSREFLLHES
jgi:hypothetical protein